MLRWQNSGTKAFWSARASCYTATSHLLAGNVCGMSGCRLLWRRERHRDMIRFFVRRFASSLVVLVIVSIAAFCLMALIPGDPAAVMAGVGASQDQIAAIHSQLGLDRPFPERLTSWLLGLAHGDFGQSITFGQPVLQILGQRLPVTLGLSALSLFW